jgi:environmental stress-induced protein Ves
VPCRRFGRLRHNDPIAMQVIRNSSFKPTAWKNGGGVTHEAIRVPSNTSAFRWRVSVAQIDASGPFSEFAGYHRKMVMLQGAGVRLTFGDASQAELRGVGDIAEFDGALATQCELLGGPCVDLNLMVSQSITGLRAWVERLREPRELQAPPQGTLVAFAVGGTISVNIENGESTSLGTWDLALLTSQDRGTIGPALLNEPAAPLVFFATIDDNSQ